MFIGGPVFGSLACIFAVRERSLVWLGYWVVISCVWLLRIPAAETLTVHLCGLTAAVFIFGWRLTIVLGAMAVLVNQLLHPLAWYTLSSQFLLAVILPASAACFIRSAILKLPINNLFVLYWVVVSSAPC